MLILISLIVGIVAGQFLWKLVHWRVTRSRLASVMPETSDSAVTRAMQQDFHRIHVRSYGLFLTAVTLVGGWFVKDLAFRDNWSSYVGSCSFISVILLVFVVGVSVLMLWAAYISYSLWLLNRAVADFDPVYSWFLFEPVRVTFNAIYAPVVDILLFMLCCAILYAYREPGASCGCYITQWNCGLFFAAFSFGIGVFIRIKSRLTVGSGLAKNVPK